MAGSLSAFRFVVQHAETVAQRNDGSDDGWWNPVTNHLVIENYPPHPPPPHPPPPQPPPPSPPPQSPEPPSPQLPLLPSLVSAPLPKKMKGMPGVEQPLAPSLLLR